MDMEELQREETTVIEQLVDPNISNKQKSRRTEVRTILFEYFTKVLSTGGRNPNWNVAQRIPKESTDKEFDDLLKVIKVRKRSYASSLWLEYRKKKGYTGGIKFDLMENDILMEVCDTFETTFAYTFSSAIENSRKKLEYAAVSHAENKLVGEFFNENNVIALQTKSKCYYKTFARLYSEALAGATPSTVSKRLLTYTIKKDKETGILIGEHFDDLALVSYFETFFETFDKELSSVLRSKEQHGILALELEEPVTTYLENSSGTVYYLAGWLLYKMRVFMRRR
jgi:hypothetical protein